MGGMERLVARISELRRSPVSKVIEVRMGEFAQKGREGGNSIFLELCFCLLTANYTSEGGMRMQTEIGDGFLHLPQHALARRLKSLGYRFPNARARYITEARKHLPIRALLGRFPDSQSLREHVADTVLGLGFKESSHFLRNIGYTDLAIIDFHILDILVEYGLIEKPNSNSLSRKKYLEIEGVLAEVCRRAGLSQGELDLYLWYLETGKILK
ncbi:MAG TPA: N-glycosylase/DNA lyase [Candidatus Bilamarchaeum sp.]|nr:N-glycosylase/DNA lyase [Candidatus Bilamarchaeum sp.]